MKGMKYTTVRHRVDFRSNTQDQVVKALTNNRHIPFTTGYIAEITNLTKGQVTYRRHLLRKWTLQDRRGQSERAKQIVAITLKRIDAALAECRRLRRGIFN